MNVNGFFNFVARAFRPSLAYSPLSRKSGFEKAQHPRFYPHLCTKPPILSRFPRQFLLWIRENFLNDIIFPKITSSALGLVSAMKADGYTLVMATGTQRFISASIAERFGIEHVLATTPLLTAEGEFSGQHLGDYCYGASKIDRLTDFLTSKGEQVENLEHLVFYTDSITDLPLIQFVEKFNGHVVATNPDPRLKELAEKRGWSVIELFAR